VLIQKLSLAIKRRIERSNELAISLAEYEYYLLANIAQHEELRNMIVPGHEDFLERKIFFEDLLNRINS
jgi:hypothetical protein